MVKIKLFSRECRIFQEGSCFDMFSGKCEISKITRLCIRNLQSTEIQYFTERSKVRGADSLTGLF